MKHFGCKRHRVFLWQAAILSLFVILFNEFCFSQAEHLAETKEVVRGMTNDVLIHEGPIELLTGKYSIIVKAPQYLRINTTKLQAVAFSSRKKNYLEGTLRVTTSIEAPLGITNCSLVLVDADEEQRTSERQSVELVIPLKIVSKEEYEAKKSESIRVLHRAQQRIGIIGGLNLANVDGVDEDGNLASTSRNMLGLGGVLELGLGKNIALRLEPMYIEKGTKDEGENVNWKAVYFEVPVFLKVAFEAPTARPYLMAGPSVGLILNSKVESIDMDLEANLIDLLNSIDFGLGFGAGISFPIGNNAIFVEGHYTHGLVDITDEGKVLVEAGETEWDERVNVKTRGIQIMAGITFPFGAY